MYLDVLHVLGCATCAWIFYMCLDVLHVPGYVTCAWMCYMCLDVLHVLGCIKCNWMIFHSQATDRTSSRMWQFKAMQILVIYCYYYFVFNTPA
jgi:hypothetical protein